MCVSVFWASEICQLSAYLVLRPDLRLANLDRFANASLTVADYSFFWCADTIFEPIH